MNFKIQLLVNELQNLPPMAAGDDGDEGRTFMVAVDWVGSERRIIGCSLGRRPERSYTSKQPAAGTVVRWGDYFRHAGKLERKDSASFHSWIVNFSIRERSESPAVVFAPKVSIDVADYLLAGEKAVRMPLECHIAGHSSPVLLEVKLQLLELQPERGRRDQRLLLLHHHHLPPPRSMSDGEYSDEEESSPYRNLRQCNVLLIGEVYDTELIAGDDRRSEKDEQEMKPPRLRRRFLSWDLARSFKSLKKAAGVPLLDKARVNGIGGDDIDIARHYHAHTGNANGTAGGGFGDEEEAFVVGQWEERSITSRDGEMELRSPAFLGSIDQRSEKAAGGSACSALAVVIADWLHRNPGRMPLRCEFDNLVRLGSSEWRRLCGDEAHRAAFADSHFDLETVLAAAVRPVKELVGCSYCVFLGLDRADIAGFAEFSKDKMSLDDIWGGLLAGVDSGEKVYIASWNDHFFVLKVAADAVYLIDTFGERLFEGCDQAYILRFDAGSVIHRCRSRNAAPTAPAERPKEAGDGGGVGHSVEQETCSNGVTHSVELETRSKGAGDGGVGHSVEQETCSNGVTHSVEQETRSNGDGGAGGEAEHSVEQEACSNGAGHSVEQEACSNGGGGEEEVVCEGMDCCKEYIKGFLAAVPLRQLQEDIEKGRADALALHRRLQIEFHYVVPSSGG